MAAAIVTAIVDHDVTGARGASSGWIVVVALLVAGLAVGYRAVFLTGSSSGEPPSGAPGGPVSAAAVARTEAATWASANIADTAVLACDTATCAELQAHGYPATALVPLTAGSGDVRRADLVVVTAAVKAQLGRNLTALTAAQPLAVFGSGVFYLLRLMNKAPAVDEPTPVPAVPAADAAAPALAGGTVGRLSAEGDAP